MRNAPSAPPIDWDQSTPCTAFEGDRRVATGPLAKVAAAVRRRRRVRRRANSRRDGSVPSVLIFDDVTARQIEVDFRGPVRAVIARLPKTKALPASALREGEDTPRPRSPGRPRLGVVGREVTLLPRQWQWLNSQPGGASVALRKLVHAAQQISAAADRRRASQEAAYRFMVAMAGNRPGFEEATRALFAADADRFRAHTARWPRDVRDHARRFAADAM
jgi:uncharacterized protein